ncbi:MAG TPA: lytic murein transglycosylase, partial [Planktomarina temperata]|nr:lytic murein transglycosylase [Planktomarina temperata]
RSRDAWARLGVRFMNEDQRTYDSKLILPGGVNSLAFVVSENFNAFLGYNNAQSYAIALGHLSDRLQGAPALQFPPGGDARGLTQAEMKFIQSRLTTLGFDTIGADGFTGPNTEIAIEAYQASQHLPVDGFAGLSLLKRLQSA